MKKYNKILEAIKRGVDLALDDYDDTLVVQNSKPKSIYKETTEVSDYIKYNGMLVNLDLPSKTMWASFNIGVNISSDLSKAENWIGNYYAWGEVEPKETYNYSTYLYHGNEKAYKMREYYKTYVWPNDNGGTLRLQDDAAYVNSNGIFRMPTEAEFEELIKHTTLEYKRFYKDIPGLNGWLFKSKHNDEELFFPETNWKADDDVASFNVSANYSCVAFYWGGNMHGANFGSEDKNMPCYLSLCYSSSGPFIGVLCKQREFGMTVRGVLLR